MTPAAESKRSATVLPDAEVVESMDIDQDGPLPFTPGEVPLTISGVCSVATGPTEPELRVSTSIAMSTTGDTPATETTVATFGSRDIRYRDIKVEGPSRTIRVECPVGADSRWVDSHCHLSRLLRALENNPMFPDLERQVHDGTGPFAKHVLITNEIDPEQSDYARIQVEPPTGNHIFMTVGCHPKKTGRLTGPLWAQIERAAEAPHVRAIGETGLDFNQALGEKAKTAQREAFRRHIRLATAQRKPLVVHCRGDTCTEVMETLAELFPKELPVHWHCFAGGEQLTASLLSRLPNVFFGIGTTLAGSLGVAHKRALQSALGQIPKDRIVLETDAPHLPLAEDKCSFPYQVWIMARAVAEVWGVSVEDVRARTTANARALYQF